MTTKIWDDMTTEEQALASRPTVKKVQGIGKFATNLMKTTKLTNKEILAQVQASFNCRTTYECIAWYRTKLRREGMLS